MNTTTKQQLELTIDNLNAMMREAGRTADFELSGSYGKVQLTRNNGSKNVSRLLSKSELYAFIEAFKDGFYAARG